jgi:hypothetical protein
MVPAVSFLCFADALSFGPAIRFRTTQVGAFFSQPFNLRLCLLMRSCDFSASPRNLLSYRAQSFFFTTQARYFSFMPGLRFLAQTRRFSAARGFRCRELYSFCRQPLYLSLGILMGTFNLRPPTVSLFGRGAQGLFFLAQSR